MEFNGTFLVSIITFIIFVILMNKILYAPILGIMRERKEYIDGNYKAADDNNLKTDELVAVKDEKLLEAKNEARTKYNATMDEYKTKKNEIITEAQASAVSELENSEIELQNLSSEVKDGLKCRMTDLANDIVEKVIGYRSNVNGFNDEEVNRILYQ